MTAAQLENGAWKAGKKKMPQYLLTKMLVTFFVHLTLPW
jgi:hypothetical protein